MTLELKQVSFAVGGDSHIYPTDLTLEPGSFNTLLGTTLAGKTTLMHLMAGLERPTTGTIWFDGEDVTGAPVQRRNVAMVYQQFINYPNFTVYENIASPLRVVKTSDAEIKRRVGNVAELLRLQGMLDRRPSELSGGQQQRTAMARALVKDSSLILLDEPLANLDFKLREELRDELPRMFADRKCVVVYATTEPVEALLLAGKTAAMHEGQVVQFGDTADVYSQPESLTSARVFSEPPLNTARVIKRGDTISFTDKNASVQWPTPNDLRSLRDGEYTFGIRPHYVTPSASGASAVAIRGHVNITEISGSESLVYFRIGDDDWISQAHGIHQFEHGCDAALYIDTARGLYFDQNGKYVFG